MKNNRFLHAAVLVLFITPLLVGCGGNSSQNGGKTGAINASDVASRVYVAPGEHDEFYAFMSGGYSGQISVYGLPSGRLLRVIPVFSLDPEKGYGFNEETKPMLMTTFGFIPWDDSHHPKLSQTNGEHDGNFLFINGYNFSITIKSIITKLL